MIGAVGAVIDHRAGSRSTTWSSASPAACMNA